MIDDYKIIEIIERKIESTTGSEQIKWVKKYETFTSRNLFRKYNETEELIEVEKIKNEILSNEFN